MPAHKVPTDSICPDEFIVQVRRWLRILPTPGDSASEECFQRDATSVRPHGVDHIAFIVFYVSVPDTQGLIWEWLSHPNFQPGMKTVCYISFKFTEKNQSGEDVLFVDKFSSISVSKAKTRKKKKNPRDN